MNAYFHYLILKAIHKFIIKSSVKLELVQDATVDDVPAVEGGWGGML